MKNRIKDLFVKEEWTVAYRNCTGAKLYDPHGCDGEFQILKNSFRYWAADPFVITVDGIHYVFFEMFDRFVGKGYLGYRTIKNGKVGKMRKAYEAKTHLSFPYIFTHDGDYYIMPESAKSRELYILKAVSFPDKWERACTLAEQKRVCDSVFLHHSGNAYLLTQEIYGPYDFAALHSFEYRDGQLFPCSETPIVNDPSNARMAGAIVYEDLRIIRPAQDCSVEYGGGICFNEVISSPGEGYREKLIARIRTENIAYAAKQTYRGIHTYNTDGQIEVIDLKNQYRFRFGTLVNLFYRFYRRIFLKK